MEGLILSCPCNGRYLHTATVLSPRQCVRSGGQPASIVDTVTRVVYLIRVAASRIFLLGSHHAYNISIIHPEPQSNRSREADFGPCIEIFIKLSVCTIFHNVSCIKLIDHCRTLLNSFMFCFVSYYM